MNKRTRDTKLEMEPGKSSVEFVTALDDGRFAVEQRLRNLIEIAVSVGRKEGLLGNHTGNTDVDNKTDGR
jgi:hypothetical protein